MPGNFARLKKRDTRRKLTVKRKSVRSTSLVNQSIKNILIQKMTFLKGEEERPVTEILIRSITSLNQIQSMIQVKEKGKEGRIITKTKNTEKGHPVTTKGREKIIMKMLMTEIITSPSQKDMLQSASPILMPLKGGMGAFLKPAPIDLLLPHMNANHTPDAEMWLPSFQMKSGLLNLSRCNWLLSCMKSRDGNV